MTLAHDIPARTKPAAGLRMSYDEFLQATFDHNHYEWVDGEAVEMSHIELDHAEIQVFLIRLLGDWVEEKGLGRVLAEPFHMKTGLELPGRSPDVMFVANANADRLERLTLRGPADLAVEIVSPGSRRTDRVDKFDEYEQGGVREYWIIDPLRRRAEFFTLIDGRFVAVAADADGRLHSKVLPGVWFRDAWFFERPAKLAVLKEWGVATG